MFIGVYVDYVKCIVVLLVDLGVNWVVMGGFDCKICFWDFNGGGNMLYIDVKGEEMVEKGLVYVFGVGYNLFVSGGFEKVV